MGLKIYWTDFSKSELHKIFDYYKETASARIAKKLVLEITDIFDSRQNPSKIDRSQ